MFMAHHIGMSLVALDNALSIGESEADGIWQRLIHGRPCRARNGIVARRAHTAAIRPASSADS